MQETNLYTVTIPPMRKTLVTLSKILDKAVAHAATKADAKRSPEVRMDALLQDRLVFDQFPLLVQVRIACDNAKGAAARLTGEEPPVFEDTEKTVPELKARIDKTVAYLDTIKTTDVVGQEARAVVLPYWNGKHLTAFEYTTEYLIPNFYFHAVTAYSILRKNGVELGKGDFIGGLPLKD